MEIFEKVEGTVEKEKLSDEDLKFLLEFRGIAKSGIYTNNEYLLLLLCTLFPEPEGWSCQMFNRLTQRTDASAWRNLKSYFNFHVYV